MKHEPIFIDLFISLDVKSTLKAKRLLTLISKKMNEKLNISYIYKSGINEYNAICHVNLKYNSCENLITESLILLDKIGEKWIVKSPKLQYEEYWKFTGERDLSLVNFKINGIKSISFNLTNFKSDRTIEEIIE